MAILEGFQDFRAMRGQMYVQGKKRCFRAVYLLRLESSTATLACFDRAATSRKGISRPTHV